MIKTSSNSMYSYMEQPFFSSQLQVSYEMIDPQYNDAVVVTLEKLYDELLTKLHNQAGKKEIFITFDKIDRVILERFGIPTKHVINPGGGSYAMMVSPPPTVDVLANKNIRMTSDNLKEILGYKKDEAKITTVDTLAEEQDFYNMLTNLVKSLDELHNQLGKGVIINNKNAKIIGLPKDFITTFSCDPDVWLDLDWTARELVAVALHEIGHAFNEIAYSYKLTRDSIVLTDTFIDNIRNKNKTPKESFLLAYADAFKDPNVIKLKDKNTIAIGLTILHEQLKHMKAETNVGGRYNLERLADQFSSKFGLQVELISALNKIHNKSTNTAYKLFGLSALIICGLIIIAFIVTSLLPLVGFVLSLVTIAFSYISYTVLWPDSDIRDTDLYGSNYERYKALRNDMIRNLRNSNLDKQTIKQAITNIETVDYLLKDLPQPRKGPLEAIKNFLDGGKQKEMQKIDELLASLSENDLHLASAKLSTLA